MRTTHIVKRSCKIKGDLREFFFVLLTHILFFAHAGLGVILVCTTHIVKICLLFSFERGFLKARTFIHSHIWFNC